ncbi:MAG: C4-type zinc ribbon domain-containing protein [Chlorobi bacterium]|nr:C4-type zinc ribbon domain-containing protein [Chlorobiota bacterium]MCI0715922.1 C4-type zinc ribbon domain-containing protein [Chlorobiota bacterium]
MKERLLLLYKLNKVDKELNELYSLRGDIPKKIEELNEKKGELEERINDIQTGLDQIEGVEKEIQNDNDALLERIEKNDELLRSGSVKTNKEYDALAKEIEDAKTKISYNEKMLKEEYLGKKEQLTAEMESLNKELADILSELELNQKELVELSKQTEEEEKELKNQREEIISKIEPEDIEHYERKNKVFYGEAVAVVRKGSCLGCYSSIPPQKSIEIRMAERVFTCESCGRILIAEELITA